MKDFNEAVKLTGNDRIIEIRKRLEDYADSDIIGIFRSANSYDSSFDFVNVFESDNIGDYIDNPYEVLRATVYGNVSSVYDYLRFNAYGNLESVSENDLFNECLDNIDDMINWLFDGGWRNCDIYAEDYELFDAWDDIDMGIYED